MAGAYDPKSVPEIQKAMYELPISKMFDCNRVDFWIKFASLLESWQEFATKYGFELPKLEVKQPSRNMGEIADAYDQQIAEKVAVRFAADFARFGYHAEVWPGR